MKLLFVADLNYISQAATSFYDRPLNGNATNGHSVVHHGQYLLQSGSQSQQNLDLPPPEINFRK